MKNPELLVLLLCIVLLFGGALACDLGGTKQPTPVSEVTVAPQAVEATPTSSLVTLSDGSQVPLPSDAELVPVGEGFYIGFATGLVEPQLFDFYAAWLSQRGWVFVAPIEAVVSQPHQRWRKDDLELLIELQSPDEQGRTVVWIQAATQVAQTPPTPPPADTPTPAAPVSQVITPANADQVALLNRLGQGEMFDVAWLPDGQTLAAICMTGIYLYDAETLAERQFMASHGWKQKLVASPDGHYLAVATENTVQLWDVGTGWLVRTLEGHTQTVLDVAFSPDGKRVATLGSENTVRLWDVTSGQTTHLLEDFDQGVSSLAFSTDGKALVTSGGRDYGDPNDTPVRFWDVETGQPLQVSGDLPAAPSYIKSLVYSPDGRLLAGSDVSEIYVWDATSGKTLHVLKGHQFKVDTLAFGPDSKLLASGSADGIVKVWDASTGLSTGVTSGQETMTIEGHTQDMIRVAFSPVSLPGTGGLLLATAMARDGLQLWDMTSGQRVGAHAPVGPTENVTAMAYNSDGRLLATGSTDETVWLWDVATSQPQRVLSGPRLGDGMICACVWSLAFSPDGKMLASGSTDAAVRLWDVGTGQLVRVLEEPTDLVDDVAFSPDGRLLAAGDGDGTLWLWDITSGQLLHALENPPTALSISFSPDGQTLATGSGFGVIRLWGVSNGQLLREMKASDNAVITVFSPDGRTLASGSSGFGPDYAVRLWEVVSGEIQRTLEGHTKDVRDVAFSPDGRLLASCDNEGITRLWDVANGQQVQTLEQEWSVESVAFSPDGERLATGGFDELIWIWGVQ